MAETFETLCEEHGLIYVGTTELHIRRKRCGRGFSYVDKQGATIRDKGSKRRFRSLAIPPAWTDVCIAKNPKAHLQAVGRDAEGRLQYRYHPDWEKSRASAKERRLIKLGRGLPRLRRAVRKALDSQRLTRATVTAAVVRLIDRALLRVGHEKYATEDGGRGAATLLKSDIDLRGETVVLHFEGKGGQIVHREIEDSSLVRILRKLKQLPGRRLFKAPGDDGNLQPVTAPEVNRYLSQTAGERVSAKDFRTFEASAAALTSLVQQVDSGGQASKRALVEASDRASDLLLNTRAIARSSYILPSIVRAYETGRLKGVLLKGRIHSGLTRMETGLLRFLRQRSHPTSPTKPMKHRGSF